MKALVLVVALLALAACSTTRPVQGTFDDGSEVFTGTSFMNGDGTGTLRIQGSRGLSCEGRWSYISERAGRGIAYCTNGKSGPFEFNGVGPRGSGSGRIGDRPFIFQYG